jgi:hypothetical protein
MNKLILATMLGAAALVSAPSFAANATDNVSVAINLTPICQITTPGALTFNYQSFQSGAATATGGAFTIKCTTSLPYKVGFDSTATPATPQTVTAAASNLQLGYSLGLSGSTTGTGTGATAISLSVTGSMASGQSGDCATGAGCTASENQAVFVVY